MVADGTSCKGEKSPVEKLTEDQARAICLDPRPTAAIARDFNVHPCTVTCIKKGKTWAHLDTPRVPSRKVAPHERRSRKLSDETILRIYTTRNTHSISKIKSELGEEGIEVSESMISRIRNGHRHAELVKSLLDGTAAP
jgi:hypothetical protein